MWNHGHRKKLYIYIKHDVYIEEQLGNKWEMYDELTIKPLNNGGKGKYVNSM